MRRMLTLLVLYGLLPAAPSLAEDAAAFPSKSMRVVIPFPPGGAADTFGRLIGAKLGEAWSQPVVADNKPGAGGQVATQIVAGAPGDGYTMLIVTVGHAVNPALSPNLPYNTEKDLKPVALVARAPSGLVVNPSVEAKSVAELLAVAKAKPKSLNYASSGNATTSHIAGVLLTTLGKVEMTHVPYRGSAPAVTDLIGGQVQLMIDPIVSSAQHVKSGKLRALAISSAARSSLAPDLPPIAETVPGYDFSAWFVLLVPASTPDAIVAKLNAEVTKALAAADVKERYVTLGAEPGSGSPAEVARFLGDEIKRYAAVVKESGMKAD